MSGLNKIKSGWCIVANVSIEGTFNYLREAFLKSQ